MNCITTYEMMLHEMTLNALKSLAVDLRAQVNVGLMSDRDFIERVNRINAVIKIKQEDEKKDLQ